MQQPTSCPRDQVPRFSKQPLPRAVPSDHLHPEGLSTRLREASERVVGLVEWTPGPPRP